MYSPSHYRSDDSELAIELMQTYDFATLVSVAPALELSHLPLMPELLPSGRLELVGHMARANPQWQAFARAPVTAVFEGPHAYISPAWYAPSAGKVPTWNYAAVHASGVARVIDDGPMAYAIMQKLTRRFEERYETRWELPDAVGDEHARLMKAIVVFRIAVEHVDAKFKLSQNQDSINRDGAIKGLERIATDETLALVDLMRRIVR